MFSNVDSEEKTYESQRMYNLCFNQPDCPRIFIIWISIIQNKKLVHQNVTGSIQCRKLRKRKPPNHQQGFLAYGISSGYINPNSVRKEIHFYYFTPHPKYPLTGLFLEQPPINCHKFDRIEIAFCDNSYVQAGSGLGVLVLDSHMDDASRL